MSEFSAGGLAVGKIIQSSTIGQFMSIIADLEKESRILPKLKTLIAQRL